MFDEIAPTYDKLNHLFTMKMDLKWRREIVNYLQSKKYKVNIILDLASGTGDLTSELLRLNPAKIFAVDFSQQMLDIQHSKIADKRLELVRADASEMPFENNYFDIVTIGFGIRNFEELEKCLKEIHRVLKSGGKFMVLEMFKSKGFAVKFFNLYFGKIMPYIGNKISGSKYAYNYLFNSVNSFFSLNDFVETCERHGFTFEYSKNNFLKVVNTVYFEKD